jgi:hypothetical protein
VSWTARLGFTRRRTLVLVILLWLGAGFVAWNYVFDKMIVAAGREYVYHQQLYQRKRGPAVTIEQIMGPAQAAALRTATRSGLATAGLGLGFTLYVTARLAARRRGATPTSAPSSPAGPR